MSDNGNNKVNEDVPLRLAERAPPFTIKDIERNVDQVSDRKVNKALFWFVTVVLTAFLGAAAATVWDLNGQVYRAVGRAEHFEAAKAAENALAYTEKLERLQNELTELKIKLVAERFQTQGKDCTK